MAIPKKTYLDKDLQKKIAMYKADHPEETLSALSKRFKVSTGQIRYALSKHAEFSKTVTNTKLGKQYKAKMLSDTVDVVEVLEDNLRIVASELNGSEHAITTRLEIMTKMINIRANLQKISLENHLKRADAGIISNIIRRFEPSATADDVIKIYEEEYTKWKAENGF